MVICFLLNFADFSLIEINISYRRIWSFVMCSYPGRRDSVSLWSFVNRTKRPSETRLSQVANISQTGTAVYIYMHVCLCLCVHVCLCLCVDRYIFIVSLVHVCVCACLSLDLIIKGNYLGAKKDIS